MTTAKKRLLLFAILTLILGGGMMVVVRQQRVQPTRGGGHLLLPQEPIDLGIIERGKTASAKVTIQNNGNDTLTIKKVFADCGCTIPDIEKRVLKAGERTQISVTFYSQGFWRRVVKNIYITSDSAAQPLGRLSLVAYVRIGVRTDVQTLDLGRGKFGDILSKQDFHVMSDSDLAGKNIDFAGDTNGLVFETGPWQPDDEAQSCVVRIGTSSLTDAPGIYRRNITVTTGSEKLPVSVTYEVLPIVTFTPANVEIEAHQKTATRVTLNHAAKMRVESVSTFFGICQASLIDADTDHPVIEVKPGNITPVSSKPDFDIVQLTYVTQDSSHQETLRIPVTVLP